MITLWPPSLHCVECGHNVDQWSSTEDDNPKQSCKTRMSGSKIGQTNTADRQFFFSDDSFLPEMVLISDHHTKYIQSEKGGSNEPCSK